MRVYTILLVIYRLISVIGFVLMLIITINYSIPSFVVIVEHLDDYKCKFFTFGQILYSNRDDFVIRYSI